MNNIPALLDKQDIASLLKISIRTLDRWILLGDFPIGRRVGSRQRGRVYWTREDIRSALDSRSSSTSERPEEDSKLRDQESVR